MKLQRLPGDATAPVGSGPKLILHVCNDIGGWGAGFVLALSQRWPEPEARYLAWAQGLETQPFALGQVQFVPVTREITVANMIAQHHVIPQNGVPPLRYPALEQCLQTVAQKAKSLGAGCHFPKFGAGLAGGDWNVIEPLIERHLLQQGIPCTLYLFE